MTEELVTRETAQLAKVKGFDEVCSNVWHYWGEKWHEGRDIFAHAPDKPLPLQIRSMYDDLMQYAPTKNSTLPPHIIARPTQDLLERWLREVHRIVVTIKYYVGPGYYYADLGILSRALQDNGVPGAPFDTYELALEAALQYALNLIQ